MFRKILVANRGEIAVRIMRACRAMEVETVALYETPDRDSLHVRLADEVVQLQGPGGFHNQAQILHIALEHGVDAIHPGYGFLAEREDFARECEAAEIVFIGPPANVIYAVRQKLDALGKAQAAGFSTPPYSGGFYGQADMPALRLEAERLGFPLMIKSCRGGRGRGALLVASPERLEWAVRRAQAESQVFYGERLVYLEKVIPGAHQVGVQVVADRYGSLVHLGEREGSLMLGNQKIVEEAPAPGLSEELRAQICQAALDLARLFEFQNVGTVEFLVDPGGHYFFTEIKPRIQIEHTLIEIRTRIDLVREQIRLAAGDALGLTQEQARPSGWAMGCRISAEDPWKNFMPSPGLLHKVRLPGGPDVRVDTYAYCGSIIPEEYDPLIAKLVVWGSDRAACLARLRSALQECQFVGTATNLSLVQRLVGLPGFQEGKYSTDSLPEAVGEADDETARRYRDLAAAAAIAYLRRTRFFRPSTPERLASGWHRSSRRLPE
jgi:acetyl-CoA carboxylase, biotin carboxylase subunit